MCLTSVVPHGVTVNKAFLSPHGERADFRARLDSRINAHDDISFSDQSRKPEFRQMHILFLAFLSRYFDI